MEGGFVVFKYVDCIDAGSPYCPCELASKGECIICSQLHGKEFCDCLNWKGTCIYQEYIWNGGRSNKIREFQKFNIVNKEYLRDDVIKLDIKVTKCLSRDLNNIGSFVFLKKEGEVDAYSIPISILNSDIEKDIITVLIKREGIKSKSILKCDKYILVKGPYWNGIQGQKFINQLKNSNCLMLCRGIASVPAILTAKKLNMKNNQIYVMLDRGRSREYFLKPYFLNLGCIVEDVSFFDVNGQLEENVKLQIKSLIKKWNFKTVFSAGNDDFHEKIINYIYFIDKYIDFATVNNSTMCCGEGICGSCIIKGRNNEKIRACKQQYNPKEVFLRGIN